MQKRMQHGDRVRVLTRNVRVAQRQLDAKVEVVVRDITQASSVVSTMHAIDGCVIIVESSLRFCPE